MAWERLYSNTTNDVTAAFTALPLVLSGPILRKVTNTEVNVWLALKESQNSIILTIYDADGYLVTTTSFTSTTQLGSNLHVVLLSLDDLNLLTNTVYYYDIVFDSNVDLTTATGGADLAYGYPIAGLDPTDDRQKLNNLPSFALPPNDLNDLRIIHGSCRKPHGGGKPGRRDALPALDKMIYEAEDNAQAFALDLNTNEVDKDIYDQTYSAKRPHQLFFTGDQIYADDVATPLLAMLVDAGKALMCGDSEILPTTPNEDALRVGYREEIMTDVAKFTSYSVGSNHLVKLQEFYAMYLFVWTDVLWPSLLPDFSTVLPNEDSTVTNVYYNHRLSETTNFENEFTDAYKSFNENKALLNDFKQDLSTVRKSMANVPTYMIFDDHDVTDDWNLHKQWVNGVHEAPVNDNLGVRVIQNALSAYTIFQHWGNVGANDGNVNTVVNIIASRNLSDSNDAQAKTVRGYLGLPFADSTAKLNFHYQIDFPLYHIVVLDTRTMRAFPSHERGAAELIAINKMAQQIPTEQEAQNKEFTLMISPAPVIGHPFVENLVQPNLTRIWNFFSTENTGELEFDKEAWAFHAEAFEKMLQRISQLGRVLILSGDVHYGFSAEIKYWNQNASPESSSAIAQLTSSSLKNEDFLTLFNASEGITLYTKGIKKFVGWDATKYSSGQNRPSYRGHTTHGSEKEFVNGSPYIEKGVNIFSLITPSDWQYSINFKRDNRSSQIRGTYPYEVQDVPAEIKDNDKLFPMTVHQNRYRFRERKGVGYNNLGELNFSWLDNYKKVVHAYWYSPEEGNGNLLPFNQLEVDLNIPDIADIPFK